MAVYTHISEKDLTQHLLRYDLGTLVSFTGMTDGIENTNYRVTTTTGDFILTIFEKRTRAEDLPFFISFMKFLYNKKIPCPDVVPDKAGDKIIFLLGKPATLTTFLQGGWPKQVEVFHAAAVGKILATMHLAGSEFSLHRENAMSLPAWKKLIENCGSTADQVEAGLSRLLQQELEALKKNWPQGFPSGGVHADLFPDNVFFTGQNLTGVIDFYFSCTDVFAYDLMLTLNAWCFSASGEQDIKKSTALLESYRNIRPLTPLEQQSLPFWGRAAAVRIIATRLYDWLHPASGAIVKLKDPLEYVRILKCYQAGEFRL